MLQVICENQYKGHFRGKSLEKRTQTVHSHWQTVGDWSSEVQSGPVMAVGGNMTKHEVCIPLYFPKLTDALTADLKKQKIQKRWNLPNQGAVQRPAWGERG